MTEARTLFAYANGVQIGTVADNNGIWSFEYDQSWLARADRFALCPNLPLKPGPQIDNATMRPVQWFFDNLLPEEAQRTLLAAEAKTATDDAWGLLTYYGKESAGALTLLKPGEEEPEGGRQELRFEALSQRVQQLPHKPLDANAPKHMAIAGAQPKLAALVEDIAGQIRLYEPKGATPSTHILKPDNRSSHWSHSAINEFFCMRLAHAVGLDVPVANFFRTPEPVYAIERFDRKAVDRQLQRVHVVDGLQLLGLSRTLKYKQALPATLKEFVEKLRLKAQARIQLFRWLVFNALIGNGDAHLKNVSFFADATGYRLAPFYDIVSTVVYDTPDYRNANPFWPHSEFVMPIGGTIFYRDLTRHHFAQAGKALGMREDGSLALLDEMLRAVTDRKQAVLDKVREIGQPTAGESRLLNSIMHLPIAEITAKLKA